MSKRKQVKQAVKKNVKKAKSVVNARSKGNRYVTEEIENGGVMFTALKTLHGGKERTDVVKLKKADVAQLKAELKRGEKGNFDKLVIEMVTKPANLDSQAKKQGLTKNTAYCPVNADFRTILA